MNVCVYRRHKCNRTCSLIEQHSKSRARTSSVKGSARHRAAACVTHQAEVFTFPSDNNATVARATRCKVSVMLL